MLPPNPPIAGPLSPEALARVIEICDRFEADWNAGRPPRIEDEIAAADEPIRAHLFRELLANEFRLTRASGRYPDLDGYLARFPEWADIARGVFARTVTSSHADPSVAVLSDQPSSVALGYELLRKLGEGGQAVTHLARDRALHRLVVLKCYHGVASVGRREAVLNEGRALARVRSPFVAACHGVEAIGDEIKLVVEYVPGRSLAELTADERADTRRCARLVERVAGGLAEVHACGLLHRDIKPANIILGDDGLPRLVDFGLAVPVASEALHELAGSPPYMAPEQARGQGERVDARTDVYGLGAVLYYLLTGKAPHAGKTRGEVVKQARDVPLVPPRRVNPRVPRPLEQICLKATASDPQSRFQSAEAMRRALGRYRLLRRLVPTLGTVVVLLALLVSAWAIWPRPARPSLDGAGLASAGGGTERQPEPKQAPQTALRVTRFEIVHFPKLDANRFDPNRVGPLGQRSFSTREDDELTVRAELSEPAYAYLIAFRPDGTDDICDPDNENTPPPKTQQPLYPTPSKRDEKYRLTEGAGLHAFSVVVSRAPLPAYREWKRRVGPIPWAARLPCEPGVVWRDDGQGPVPILDDDPTAIRGKGVKARDNGEPAAKLASWLRSLPGVDLVTLEAFPVEPASGP